MKLHIIWCNPLWLWLKIMLRVSTRWSNRPKGKKISNRGLLGGLFCRKIGILRIENVTRVAFLFHRRLNFWLTCKVLGLKWCQECLLEHQIGQNAVFFSKGGLLGVLFYPKGVILPFPNVTRIFLKTCGKLIYCPRSKILGLKWCQEYLLEDPLGQNANFFQKGGFWRGYFIKK